MDTAPLGYLPTRTRPALIRRVSVLEARMVANGRRGSRALGLVADLLALPVISVGAASLAEMAVAFRARITYGKGCGHPAALNLGDPFAYALAKVRRTRLLFQGKDFALTDTEPVMG